MIKMRTWKVFIAILAACLLIIIANDKKIINYVATNGIVPEKISPIRLHNEAACVWKSPETDILSLRSIYNPDLWYDRQKEEWYIVARYTRGHRAVQYILAHNPYIDELDGGRITMLLFVLDKHFVPKQSIPIYSAIEPYPGLKSRKLLWWNGEDPRVFYNQQTKKFTVQATVHRDDGRICLGHGPLIQKDTVDAAEWDVEYICEIKGQGEESQKNWSYIRGDLYLTHCYPYWQIVRMAADGVCQIYMRVPSAIKEEVRCTTKLVSLTEHTYLTLLHTHKPYRTVFCEVDKRTLLPIRYSRPVTFFETQTFVEFPSGLFIHDLDVYIGLGLNDCEGYVFKLPVSRVLEVLSL